jgi:MFS family permease
MRARLARTFSSLTVRNYRLYFVGQITSTSGNWMQQIAVAWLVLKLTNSPLALGFTTAAQQAPYLVFGAWGGLLADRLPTRRLLICTQAAHMIAPTALWLLYEQGATRMWMVYGLVMVRGLVNTVDNPARQAFVAELVDRDRLVNAVSLNASITQAGRLVGPAAAALVIATLGLGPCFLINALSFAFMGVLLLLVRSGELQPGAVTERGKGQLRAGFTYAARTPGLRVPLLLVAVVGLLSFNFTVVLPAVARFTFHGTATTYALLMNFLAVGALGGALATSTRVAVTPRVASWAAVAFGAALGLAAATSNLDFTLAAMIFVGATSVIFTASVQASLQLAVEPEMRGRVLSLYQILYAGTTPMGAILVGWLASTSGARSGLVLGCVAAILAGAAGLRALPPPRGLVHEALE